MRKTSNDYLTISDFKPAENQMLYLTDDIVVSGSLSNVPNSDGQHFQMGFFSIINCLKGKIHIEVNGKPYEMTANDFLFIFPSMQINYVETSQENEIRLAGFSTRFLLRLRQRRDMQVKILHDFTKQPVFYKGRAQRRDKFRYYTDLINYKLSTPDDSPFREDIIEYLFSSLLCEVIDEVIVNRYHAQGIAQHRADDTTRIQRGPIIFKEFLEHVNSDKGMHRSLAYFADKMCYSPKYLSSVIKQMSGRSPMDWINEATIEQIKYQLVHTEKPMKEIADHFDFPNQSFFGKYVKAHLGMSPVRYREERTRG